MFFMPLLQLVAAPLDNLSVLNITPQQFALTKNIILPTCTTKLDFVNLKSKVIATHSQITAVCFKKKLINKRHE